LPFIELAPGGHGLAAPHAEPLAPPHVDVEPATPPPRTNLPG
jgi:hypothetical protein